MQLLGEFGVDGDEDQTNVDHGRYIEFGAEVVFK